MKTAMSRFQIHDDLTAPEGSVPVLRGALATGGQLPDFLRALAGSPAARRVAGMEAAEDGRKRPAIATEPVAGEPIGAPGAQDPSRPPCCPLYHEAVELIGRRWTGAIVSVLIHRSTLRFGEIADSVPEL